MHFHQYWDKRQARLSSQVRTSLQSGTGRKAVVIQAPKHGKFFQKITCVSLCSLYVCAVVSHSVVSVLCNLMEQRLSSRVALQAPLSMASSRQKYQNGLPCPPPGDLPNPGIKPRSPALQIDSLPSEPPGKPWQTRGTKRQTGGTKVHLYQWADSSTI